MSKTRTDGWQPISTAPKDTPIIGWCVRDADPYFLSDTRLTPYRAFAEEGTEAEDGPHVLVWGGGYTDWDEGYPVATMPDWWFVNGTDDEVVANPTHWMPLPPAPERIG